MKPNVKWSDDPKAYVKAWRLMNNDRCKTYRVTAYIKRHGKQPEPKIKLTREEIIIRSRERDRKRYPLRRKEALRYQKSYRARTTEKQREYARQKHYREMADPSKRIRRALRARIREALKGNLKGAGTINLLGCSISSFRIYLESRFEQGMSWDNYGSGWHLGHIIPCAIFDLTRLDHQKRCFHFSNIRPQWAIENMKLGARIFTNQLQLL